MAAQERTYVLGGETRRRALFASSGRVIAARGVFLVVWMLVLLDTHSLVVLIVGLLVGGAGEFALARRTALGESWTGKVWDGVVFRFTHRRPVPDFVPGEALPPEVGEVRMLSYAPPARPNVPMAIVHHKDHARRSWATGHLTATIEIKGGGDGLLPVRAVNTSGLLFERLLGGLASAEIPVDQLDIATRILPVHPDAYREHMRGLVVAGTPARLRRSMAELSTAAAGNTEEYRSFVTLRIPLAQLAAGIAGPADLERVAEETFATLGEVVRRFDGAGYQLRHVLGPRRLGALIRHLHDPDVGIDTQEGIATVADGWGYTRWAHPQFVRIEGAARDWYHAVGHIPRDAWPQHAVGARWMEHLVTRVNPATIRTVVAQFRLVPKAQARDLARVGLTYDVADARTERRKGQVADGVTQAAMSASRRTLHDLLQPVVAGTYPSVRVMISAPDDPELLTAARRRVTTAAENGGVARIAWQDNRHHRALITALPMARGVRA
ncbi:hypothetical protein ACIOJE_34960 [Kitasatospora sp. NPDC087861]|uniref:hypothetical protein n=1 Tax=Kitasatospora sp. NPDC087861 TaxID=3364070 RepID=UPI0038173DCC